MQTNLFAESRQGRVVDFPTSYHLILERIDLVNPVKYSQTRNYISGAVTYLSPYISRGVITVSQVREAVLQKGYKRHEIEKFLQELAWREYFQRVWQQIGNGISSDIKQVQPGVLHHEMVAAILHANTGIVAIDELLCGLTQTGYMHNHARMYIASITCNLAKAHWLQPAKWMYYHLLDGDIASNNCSWQWVAGAFSSKKYYCNQENINRYTGSAQLNTFLDASYEVLGDLRVPAALEERQILALTTTLPVTRLPLLDLTKPTLIYNSYNLDPLWRANEDVNRVLLLEPAHFSKYPVSEKVLQFIIDLSQNIAGIQVYAGDVVDIAQLYAKTTMAQSGLISKEHPAFEYYPGIKDTRDWMFPKVSGHHSSFFSFWKKAAKYHQSAC